MERRRHRRFAAMGLVEVVPQGGPAQEGYLASIGRGGLGLYLPVEVRPSQLLLVRLPLLEQPAGETEVKVAARVRWARAVSRLFMAGVAFERMSDARYDRLLGHLRVVEALQVSGEEADLPPPARRLSVRE